MKKIELEIIALSHSITQTHSYAVVLGEVNGLRRLPIVIGSFEAQAIAVALERMQPSRPLTHDLMKNFMNAFEIELMEIVITELHEGIFYSKLICISEKDTVEIDSRTSDAIALAVRFGCPIYTYDHILDNAGIVLDDAGNPNEGFTNIQNPNEEEIAPAEPEEDNGLKALTMEELEERLNTVLENEDYIAAIAIRDEIKRRNK